MFFSFIVVFTLFLLFFNLKPSKTPINNKILLRNLLESLDLELPDELKRLENPSTDAQKLS